MALDNLTKDLMLDTPNFTEVRFHSADPGAASANQIAGATAAVTYDAAEDGVRSLAGAVSIISTEEASVDATFYTIWDGLTRRVKTQLTPAITLEPNLAKNLAQLDLTLNE
jgi:hypothetical protein